MFSDESHFEVNGHRSQYVRGRVGEALNSFHKQQAPKHPPKKIQKSSEEDILGMVYI